jgi:putative effector of murein hydrolase
MITGATTELTMAAVLLTGLYGASGQWLLDTFSVVDPITTGVAVGTSSHSIGMVQL